LALGIERGEITGVIQVIVTYHKLPPAH
jgi:hypothetical protein